MNVILHAKWCSKPLILLQGELGKDISIIILTLAYHRDTYSIEYSISISNDSKYQNFCHFVNILIQESTLYIIDN